MRYYTDAEVEDLSKNLNFSLSKADNEFFDEEKHKKQSSVFRMKHYSSKKNGNGWGIYKDDELLLEIKEYRLNKKEKKFAESSEGISFILKCVKEGLRSIADLKRQITEKSKETATE